MFKDYQSSVFQDYQRKKADNAISSRLIDPTPARIKEECAAVCLERYAVKDEPFLRDFFGKRENCRAYVQAIENHETDKFKPLLNYLRGKVGMTEKKNIELLAWLIDFQPRPFELGRRYVIGKQLERVDKEIQEEEEVQVEEEQEERYVQAEVKVEEVHEEEDMQEGVSQIDNNKALNSIVLVSGNPKKASFNLKIRPAIILMFLIMSIGACVYLLLRKKKPAGPQSCMYWAGDHYEQVSCNQKVGDALVVALDSGMLNDFKRITEPDTITGKCKGKVWYVKVAEGIEFYTSDGFHPIQPEKRLRPLTDYIIYKYVHHE